MDYRPFERGPYPVGVRTVDLHDERRARTLPTEIWYPAVDAVAGRDLDPTTRDSYPIVAGPPGAGSPVAWQLALRDAPARLGAFPLLVFSHGFGGHRRQSTFFCTHVASHGYIVAAIDHPGDTVADVIARARKSAEEQKQEARAMVGERPRDLCFAVDQLVHGRGGPATSSLDALDQATPRIERTPRRMAGMKPSNPVPRLQAIPRNPGGVPRVAVAGHSFGGFTALAAVRADPRIAVVIALAPAGGASPAGGALHRAVDLDWRRIVPTLFIAGDEDSVLPIEGIKGLYERVVAPKRLVTIRGADHFHFCDAANRVHELFRAMPPLLPLARPLPRFDQLCAREPAYDIIRGAGLAHLDAFLRQHGKARDFLSDQLAERLRRRGVEVDLA